MQLSLGDIWVPETPPPHRERPIRILAFDETTVFYDVWLEGMGWGLQKVPKNCAFYQMATRRVIAGKKLRTEPLTARETARFRPDLPAKLYRHPSLNWAHLDVASPELLVAAAAVQGVDVAAWPDLRADAIALVWFPNNRPNGPMIQEQVTAGLDGIIRAADLLWHAQKLVNNQIVDDGIGLFRSAVYRGMPSYYIRGYHDLAGSSWRHEQGVDQGTPPEWRLRPKPSTGSYPERLKAMKRQFPFKQWRAGEEGGLDQYSKENCDAMAAIFDKLLKRLIALGVEAAEADKLAAFKEAIEATNELNEREMNLIETGERDELCELCNEIARAAGLDPTKYGGGEGPASEWRDW